VYEIAALLKATPHVEYNIEGDPRHELLELVLDVRPTQCTLVPVTPGEITSQAGWPADTSVDDLSRVVGRIKNAGVRVSVFVDPEEAAVRLAARVGGDRVELYTEPFARAFEAGRGEASFETYVRAAALAHALGLGVNAGHDLDLRNLPLFRGLPHLQEVSIGHALISHALSVGLERSVRDYLDALR
jgi:pyridoxine 5-phosphate synthase